MTLGQALAARRGYLVVTLAVLLLDQATKVAAHLHLRGAPTVVVIPNFLNLTYSRNPGGLFGYFGDLGQPWRGVLLTALPILAIGLILFFLLRSDDIHHRSTRFGLALILGGALGNLIDRLARGEVVDFLDVYASAPRLADWLVARFGTAHWPTFNVADSAIVVGAGLLLLDMLRPQPDARRRRRAAPAAGSGDSG